MLNLNKITLIGVDGRDNKDLFDLLVRITKKSIGDINFGSVKIISGYNNQNKIDNIETIHKKINSVTEYSKFCINELINYVDTEYCILFQTDGFIINPEKWSDDFLKYDYIGAPWPLYFKWVQENRRVGNGGFSLRSKKLLELTKTIQYKGGNEDYQICYQYDTFLKNNGIKFAPVDIASKFSLEMDNEFNSNIENVFGFHGAGREKEIIKKYNI